MQFSDLLLLPILLIFNYLLIIPRFQYRPSSVFANRTASEGGVSDINCELPYKPTPLFFISQIFFNLFLFVNISLAFPDSK
jgi:hypothetical protein